MLGGMAELLIAITVALVLTASFLPIQRNMQDTSSAATAAWQIATIRDSAAQYIKANWNTELAAVQGGPIALPIATLQPHYLPAAFGGAAPLNPWQQRYAIVLEAAPGNPNGILGFVVSYGGNPIPARVIATAATLVGNYGGYFPYAADTGYSTCAAHPCVKGIGNFYWQDMTPFSASGNTGAFVPAATATNNGHLVAGLFFSGGDQAAPYLYRQPEPSDLSLNSMETDLYMTDPAIAGAPSHNIVKAKNITANGSITLTGASATDANITLVGTAPPSGKTPSSGNIITNGMIWVGPGAPPVSGFNQGDVLATDAMFAPVYFHNSDRSLKKNISPIDDPLTLVDRLAGHRFQWKRDDSWDLGLVAQEVQQVVPEAVGRGADGKLTVKYDVMVAPLIEAVKVLDGRVQQLEGELAEARRQQAEREGGDVAQ